MKEIPDIEKIRRRHKDVLPEPMFEISTSSAEPRPKAPSKKSAGRRYCPTCKAKVATFYEGVGASQVLVFRDHDRVTYGGHRFRCTSSGADASEAKKAS